MMKRSMSTIFAAVTFTALVSVPALAAVTQSDIKTVVKSNTSSDSMILADVDNSTVILTGYFGDINDKNELLAALGSADGVERVVDYTVVKQGVSYTK